MIDGRDGGMGLSLLISAPPSHELKVATPVAASHFRLSAVPAGSLKLGPCAMQARWRQPFSPPRVTPIQDEKCTEREKLHLVEFQHSAHIRVLGSLGLLNPRYTILKSFSGTTTSLCTGSRRWMKIFLWARLCLQSGSILDETSSHSDLQPSLYPKHCMFEKGPLRTRLPACKDCVKFLVVESSFACRPLVPLCARLVRCAPTYYPVRYSNNCSSSLNISGQIQRDRNRGMLGIMPCH
jgi:hypothetical protein